MLYICFKYRNLLSVAKVFRSPQPPDVMDEKARDLIILISVLALITSTYALKLKNVSNQTSGHDTQEPEQAPIINDTVLEPSDSLSENKSGSLARGSDEGLVSQSVNGLNQLYSDAVNVSTLLLQSGEGS
jgi:hypothetical protein